MVLFTIVAFSKAELVKSHNKDTDVFLNIPRALLIRFSNIYGNPLKNMKYLTIEYVFLTNKE